MEPCSDMVGLDLVRIDIFFLLYKGKKCSSAINQQGKGIYLSIFTNEKLETVQLLSTEWFELIMTPWPRL